MLNKLAVALSGDDKLSGEEYSDMLKILQSVKDDAPAKSSGRLQAKPGGQRQGSTG